MTFYKWIPERDEWVADPQGEAELFDLDPETVTAEYWVRWHERTEPPGRGGAK